MSQEIEDITKEEIQEFPRRRNRDYLWEDGSCGMPGGIFALLLFPLQLLGLFDGSYNYLPDGRPNQDINRQEVQEFLNKLNELIKKEDPQKLKKEIMKRFKNRV